VRKTLIPALILLLASSPLAFAEKFDGYIWDKAEGASRRRHSRRGNRRCEDERRNFFFRPLDPSGPHQQSDPRDQRELPEQGRPKDADDQRGAYHRATAKLKSQARSSSN
jgi:hypothetical protein